MTIAAGDPMDQFSALIAGLASDLKGALASGIVAVILDRGTIWRRLINGVGAVVFSMAVTRGFLDLTHLTKTDDTVAFFAAIFALLGIIITESMQRIGKRVFGRVEKKVDTIAGDLLDRLPGGKNDAG